MAVEGHIFDGPVRSTLVPAGSHGCEWSAVNASGCLPFVTRVRFNTTKSYHVRVCEHTLWRNSTDATFYLIMGSPYYSTASYGSCSGDPSCG